MRSASTVGNTNSNPIARDIQNVVSDAQELLKTVQSEGQSKLTDVQDGAKEAMDTTDAYVRSNPWRAVGVSAAVGALIGFLIARR
jgi:ElaB/YqjD/DUF883 family membrane-anchored ribosome-binding protein